MDNKTRQDELEQKQRSGQTLTPEETTELDNLRKQA